MCSSPISILLGTDRIHDGQVSNRHVGSYPPSRSRNVLWTHQFTTLQNRFDQLESQFTELNQTYTGLNQQFTELNQAYTDLNRTYTDLNQTYWGLDAKYNALNEDYASLSENYTSLGKDYDDLKTELTAVRSELQRYKAQEALILIRPTLQELEAFLREDRTDAREYVDPSYICQDFAIELRRNAIQRGFNVSYVSIAFTDGMGHVINGCYLDDGRFVYIEPQTDEFLWDLREGGKFPWEEWLDWTIERIRIIW
ncbi:MAG: hypothetical protein ACE5OY_04660 [Candidatus Bathyarchaeia archaeon]